VTDYWHLVYSAFRHNRRPSYWVVLEPPAVVPGLEGPVRAVEIVSPEERTAVPARASYLAESFEVLAAPRVLAFARIEAGTQGAGRFRRGDANADGALNLADALAALNYLFLAGAPPACEKSADANDSGGLDLADGLHLLNYLYLDGPPPPEPFLFCGVDPTADRLGCRRHAPCAR
jgi:hypothetical protein